MFNEPNTRQEFVRTFQYCENFFLAAFLLSGIEQFALLRIDLGFWTQLTHGVTPLLHVNSVSVYLLP